MFPVDWLLQLVFGTLYGAGITLIALLAAIPYGLWQGAKWLGQRLTGGIHGDTPTG